ncbi:MAG: DUF1015 domain-containing protein [Bacteroidales bacterium]|nr:DUF1015 domain-containing protein [Candidatus Colicola faecequi]
MATIKPFKAVRPPKELVAEVTARPYDVLSTEEAREESAGNPKSLYHINRPEINFPVGTDEHDPRVYGEAHRQYELFKANGWLLQDAEDQYYVYAQTMNGKTQYGLMVTAAAEDYENGIILRHELTRRDKEDDRMRHIDATNANIGPAFFAYPAHPEMKAIIAAAVAGDPEYDFTTGDGIRHRMWIIAEKPVINRITEIFRTIPKLYIADGHHRSAASVRVAQDRRAANPNHTGNEEYNFFLTACFAADELTVIDYNRVVMDLHGYTPAELLERLSADFEVADMGTDIYKPACKHEFSLYLGGHWYKLTTRPEHVNDEDPIECLDVAISSKLILDKQFGITDLRGDKRIDFVGGIRGLGELKKRVDSGEAACALALYPVTMEQIFAVADTGNIMPPKATWFEPKLRSGVVIHELD